MTDAEHAVLARALKKYGKATQLRKCVEELSELITAICHLADPHRPRPDAVHKLAEEMADVDIMLTQVRHIHPGLDEAVATWRGIKIVRLRAELNRLEKPSDDD